MSYYIVIPAEVRHAKILDGAKLLFGDIAGLCKKEGYCWATNAHLAEVSGMSQRQVIRYIRMLEDEGFVRCEMADPETRHIHILTQASGPVDASGKGWHDADVNHTNTSSTNKKTIGDLPEEEVFSYFAEWGFKDEECRRMTRAFIDYNSDGKVDAWKKRAATWKNRAIDYGSVKAPIGPFEEHQVRDEQLGSIDTSRWKKTERGYFRR